MAIIPSISKRYSPVHFSSQEILRNDLTALIEAAGMAASAFNNQPWRFIYLEKDDPEFNSAFNSLAEPNQKWVASAPAILIVLCLKNYEKNGRPNSRAFYETGMAMGNLSVQATSMGLYLHQMAGYNKEELVTNLRIPEKYDVIVTCALGYPDDIALTDKDLQERASKPRSRLEVDKVLFLSGSAIQ